MPILRTYTPPHSVRPMLPADQQTVCQLDRDVFETYHRQQRQLKRSLRLRTPGNMHAAFNRPVPGVVVESPPGKIVGYCFTHIWGTLGWLGTLGIEPRRQGFGLGRAVIMAGLEHLRAAGCQTLALETMPENGKNLALYTRLGLEPCMMTMICRGEPTAAATMHFDIRAEDDDLHHDLSHIAARLMPGLDPTPVAQWLAAEDAGVTLVWREQGTPVAFAMLRGAARRLKDVQSYMTVEAAGCVPKVAANWSQYLSEMQTYAQRQRKSGLLLPVNTHQLDLLRHTLAAGFRIAYTRARLVQGAALGGPDDILMLTLAM